MRFLFSLFSFFRFFIINKTTLCRTIISPPQEVLSSRKYKGIKKSRTAVIKETHTCYYYFFQVEGSCVSFRATLQESAVVPSHTPSEIKHLNIQRRRSDNGDCGNTALTRWPDVSFPYSRIDRFSTSKRARLRIHSASEFYNRAWRRFILQVWRHTTTNTSRIFVKQLVLIFLAAANLTSMAGIVGEQKKMSRSTKFRETTRGFPKLERGSFHSRTFLLVSLPPCAYPLGCVLHALVRRTKRWVAGNSMAHLMATQSVLDFGSRSGNKRRASFPRVWLIAFPGYECRWRWPGARSPASRKRILSLWI